MWKSKQLILRFHEECLSHGLSFDRVLFYLNRLYKIADSSRAISLKQHRRQADPQPEVRTGAQCSPTQQIQQEKHTSPNKTGQKKIGICFSTRLRVKEAQNPQKGSFKKSLHLDEILTEDRMLRDEWAKLCWYNPPKAENPIQLMANVILYLERLEE